MTITAAKKKITNYGELNIRLAERHRIKKFTQFNAEVYNTVSRYKKKWKPIASQVLMTMELEDRLHFPHGYFFELIDRAGQLIGTTKITLKTNGMQFPFESYFGVDIQEQLNNLGVIADEIWHFGRLVVSSKKNNIKALNTLLFHSLSIVSRNRNNVLIAECDADVCRKLELIGIRIYKAGLPKDYIGSPTFPIIALAQDLRKYLKTVNL